MSIERIQQITINKLLDKYEKSRTFMGLNQVSQSFERKVGELFPRYNDDSEYEFFCDVNEALKGLEKAEFIKLKVQKNGIITKVSLNVDRLDICYNYVYRQPKKEEHTWLLETIQQFAQSDILERYYEIQRNKISKNLKVEYFDGNKNDYVDLLKLVSEVLKNEEEQYIRDFSIKIFGDSKRVEQLASKTQALLFQYGEFQDKDSVLEECGIVRTPTYVCMKGKAVLRIEGKVSRECSDLICDTTEMVRDEQVLDLSQMKGDIALSTASLKELSSIHVIGKRIVTVENLTSFHDYEYENSDDFVIYLGGFHNKVKRNFLSFLYEQNPEKEYLHFGDIDAGGFYIYEHLREKTGIPFKLMHMDVETLKRHIVQTKTLTSNDRMRIQKLLEKQKSFKENVDREDYSKVLEYMLENDCKLEQEAVNVRLGCE